MVIPIEINSDDIRSQFTITDEQLDTMFDNIAKGLALVYYGVLENIVTQQLHSTRRRYLENLRLVDRGRMEGTVILDYSKDPLISMLEQGASPFDMKTDMLRSPKAKTSSKGNKYLTIPFRWATPSAIGESELFTGKMPQSVYDLVKDLPLTQVSSGGGKRSLGLSSSSLPQPLSQLGVRKQISNAEGQVFKEYTHKNSIYEGIRKQQDTVTGQNTYFSFRRVSELSDPDAFIHTGITAKNLMRMASDSMNVDQEIGPLIDRQLQQLGFL